MKKLLSTIAICFAIFFVACGLFYLASDKLTTDKNSVSLQVELTGSWENEERTSVITFTDVRSQSGLIKGKGFITKESNIGQTIGEHSFIFTMQNNKISFNYIDDGTGDITETYSFLLSEDNSFITLTDNTNKATIYTKL